ncbi:MAG: hypothetical protein R3E72_09540 [Steroidobacteraceae bacterium]
MKSACARLAAAADQASLEQRVRNLLISLEPIEFYWAFPSEAAWKALWQLLERGHFDELSSSVTMIVRALVSGSYRRRTRRISAADDDLAALEEELRDDQSEDRQTQSPYFEVLIVDSLTAKQQDAQRRALQGARRADDLHLRTGLRAELRRRADRRTIQFQYSKCRDPTRADR